MNEDPVEPAPDRYFGLTIGSWMRLALLLILFVAIAANVLQRSIDAARRNALREAAAAATSLASPTPGGAR